MKNDIGMNLLKATLTACAIQEPMQLALSKERTNLKLKRLLGACAALALLALMAGPMAALAGDATLYALTPSEGTLVPTFDPGILAYTDEVPWTTTTMTVTAVPNDSAAAVTVNGYLLPYYWAPSEPLSLGVGSTNVFTIVVVSADLATTNTTTLTVTRDPGTNAALSGLTVSAGTLTPSFDGGTYSYADSVSYLTGAIAVTPTAADPYAAITVNGVPVGSGFSSGDISLSMGVNPAITIQVVSQDSTHTNTYTLTVTRRSDDLLSALTISAGALTSPFDPSSNNYTATAPYTTTSMTVTPTADDPGATITVNGTAVRSGVPSGDIRLNTGTNNLISIAVVSADQTSTNTYLLAVSRTDSAVYEPFDYASGANLNGQAVNPVTGLSGTWTASNLTNSTGSLNYPGYATLGNRPVTTYPYPSDSGNNVSKGWAAIGTTLSAAGLLNPGATLWYSALVVAEDNVGGSLTRRTYVGIGSGTADGFDRYGTQNGGRSGTGLKVNGLTVFPQGWKSANGSVTGPAVTIPAGVNLIVGKITWSPDGVMNHTNQIYLPDSGLVLPSTPASTLAMTVSQFDQSTYTNISFAGMNPNQPQVDEIRFGASYASVIGLANPVYWDLNGTAAGAGSATPTGAWDATSANWNLVSDGTGSTAAWTPGQSAVFAAGTDATGTYTVTVNGVQDVSGLVFNSGTLTLANGTAGGLRMTAPTRVTVGSGLTATVQTPISDNGGTQVMSTGGAGTLVLSGDNSAATGGMSIFGPIRFESPSAMNGTARNITVNSGGVVVFGPSFGAANIPAALSGRIVSTSAGAIAADNYPTTAFDFNAAGLPSLALGAVGSVSYTGTLTPNGTSYILGGGGGTLTMANPNAVTGAGNSLLVQGDVTLPNANDYGGGTTLQTGTLAVGNDGALGTGGLTINGGTIQSGDSTAHTLSNVIAINGNFGVGGTGDLTFSDTSVTPLAKPPVFTINNANTAFAQAFSGSVGLTKSGTGKLLLTGASTYTGATSISGGTLSINSIAASQTASPIGAWPTVNNASIIDPTALVNSGSTYTAAASLVLAGGTFNYTGPTASTDRGFNITAASTINVSTPGTALSLGQIQYNLSGAITINGGAGSSLTFGPVPNNGTANYIANIQTTVRQFNVNARTITLNGTATGCSVPGPIYCNGGTGGIAKSGTGTWTLSGANQYNGATTVNAGTLQFAQAVSLPYGLNGMPALSPALLVVNSTGTLALNVGGAGEFATTDLDTFLSAMSASTATTGFKTGSALGLDTSNAGGSFTPSGDITLGTGAVGVTKLGTGSLVLNVANSYSGPTTVTAGTLALSGSGSIDNSATINVGAGAVLNVSGRTDGTLTLGAAQTLKGNGTVTGNVAVNGTLSPGASIGTLTIGGNLTLNAGATSTFEIDGSTPTNDVVVLGAAVTYGGALNIVTNGAFTAGQTFKLFSGPGATNASNFASIAGNPGNGLSFAFTNGVLTVVGLTPPTLSSFGPLSGGSFPLTFSGPSGQSYKVLSSTNVAFPLTNWTVLTSGTFGAAPVSYSDAGATNQQQFYRIQSP